MSEGYGVPLTSDPFATYGVEPLTSLAATRAPYPSPEDLERRLVVANPPELIPGPPPIEEFS